MCMAVTPPKEPPKAGSPGTEPGSLANPYGFDFTGLSDYEFRQVQEQAKSDRRNFMTVEAQARQAEAIQKEIDRRDAPRRLAEERLSLIASQQAAMASMQKQAADQIKAQEATVADLQRQRDEGIARIKADSEAQQAQIRGQAAKESKQIGMNAGAVASSLRMLALNGGKQGPTAAVAGRRNGQTPAGRATTASLRMGSTGRGAGAGANIAT